MSHFDDKSVYIIVVFSFECANNTVADPETSQREGKRHEIQADETGRLKSERSVAPVRSV